MKISFYCCYSKTVTFKPILLMRLCNGLLPTLLLLTLFTSASYAQGSAIYSGVYNLPEKYFSRLSAKSKDVEHRLSRQIDKYLVRLAAQERKLQRRLWRKDSTAAKELFGDVSARYAGLQGSLSNSQSVYSGHLDSMRTALNFLQQSTKQIPATQEKLKAALANYEQLQRRLNQTDAIKKYLKERQRYLKQHLEKFGLSKEFRKLQREIYYFRAQADEIKRLWEDPSKLEAKLLQLANKIPAFRDFFSKHSALASMFRLPANDPAATAVPIPGLQTRASIQQDMLARFGSGPDVSRAMQQNIQSAQAQIKQLKDKVNQLGGNGSDMDMPDFRVNQNKVKSFWNRLELGANVQSVRDNGFPVTSDLGISLGYRLGNRSTIGIGGSYKVGWGQSIRQVKITSEGISIRSFIDIRIKSKGAFFASGGFEYNYQQPFNSLQQLQGSDNWSKSGLLGIGKTISARSKLFKKTKVQLLWDFLSYQQIPKRQPIIFRVCYGFK
jgi:hypothetical protein